MIELLTQYRHDLHRIPELGFNLPKTFAYIERIVQSLDCHILYPAQSSICAYFDFGKADAFAFRSDMDALPITEQQEVDYQSQHPGCMHACGHDGHMAMLLGFANVLAELSTCKHNVLLIFQPAEETTGGAKAIVDSGIFTTYHVTKIFGFHLWPNLTAGTIASRPGPLMARSSELSIDIQGQSTHVAKANEGLDALAAGIYFLAQAYEMEKTMNPNIHRLLKFGKFHSGTARNSISNHTTIQGTLRTFHENVFIAMKQQLYIIATTIESQTGCTFTLQFSQGYPPLCNHESIFAQCIQILPELQIIQAPSMLTEDFSFYLQKVPGLFFYLGTGNNIPLHASNFQFDDHILIKGVNTYRALLELP